MHAFLFTYLHYSLKHDSSDYGIPLQPHTFNKERVKCVGVLLYWSGVVTGEVLQSVTISLKMSALGEGDVHTCCVQQLLYGMKGFIPSTGLEKLT
jgi:hypothetical protein